MNQDLFQATSNDELLAMDDQIKVRKDEYEALAAEIKILQASKVFWLIVI